MPARPEPSEYAESVVTVTFEPHGEAETLMTISHDLLDPTLVDQHHRGWLAIADQMESALRGQVDVLILGAGFGGLELAVTLLESLASDVRVTLVDRGDSFMFSFSKLELLLGRQTRSAISLPYRSPVRPGVTFRQEEVVSIDPATRRVVTSGGTYDPDVLVVALGADYDPEAAPGFVHDGHEFYSADGAERLYDTLSTFQGGSLVLAVLGVPFKCPPAPYEGAFLIHEFLVERGVRDATRMHVITPMPSPIPVSPPASEAIVAGMVERGIEYTPGHRVSALDPSAHVARLGPEDVPYDLFIGVPVHRVPALVEASGLTAGGDDGWVHVDPGTLARPFPGVYALGDCADAAVPRAGVFAESAARVVADQIVSLVRGTPSTRRFEGAGTCYIEFGDGLVGKVDANFLSGPAPVAPFVAPSLESAQEKQVFAHTRRRRWFGL
jgi:sulfide:quinone oxidoreductase